MADTAIARDLAPDLVGVKSRVSWSAILAGTVVALACYLVLTLLFAAVGISLTEAGVRTNAVGIGVLIAAILTIVVSMFLGGWVASQMTVGENRQEAGIYGILLWATVTAISAGALSQWACGPATTHSSADQSSFRTTMHFAVGRYGTDCGACPTSKSTTPRLRSILTAYAEGKRSRQSGKKREKPPLPRRGRPWLELCSRWRPEPDVLERRLIVRGVGSLDGRFGGKGALRNPV